MKKPLIFVAALIYATTLIYLLLGTFGFGLRIGGNMYFEETFGQLRLTYLILLILLMLGGLLFLWRNMRRSV